MIGNAPLSHLTGVPGWESEGEQNLLHELAQTVPANGLILEIGGEFGMSASVFCKGADPSVRVITVDLFPGDLLAHHRGNLDEAGFGGRSEQVQVNSHETTWFEVYGTATREEPLAPVPIDLLFIDGDHSYEGVLADLNNWAGFVKGGGLLVLHDVACQTNKIPHPLHFEVSRALAEWLDPEIFTFVKSVDSTVVFRRAEDWEETEPRSFDNPPEVAIPAEAVAKRVEDLLANGEPPKDDEDTKPLDPPAPAALEDMSRADLLRMAEEKGKTFPANARTSTIIQWLRDSTGE